MAILFLLSLIIELGWESRERMCVRIDCNVTKLDLLLGQLPCLFWVINSCNSRGYVLELAWNFCEFCVCLWICVRQIYLKLNIMIMDRFVLSLLFGDYELL